MTTLVAAAVAGDKVGGVSRVCLLCQIYVEVCTPVASQRAVHCTIAVVCG